MYAHGHPAPRGGYPEEDDPPHSLVTEKAIESGSLAAPPRPRLPADHRIVLGFAQTGAESNWRIANTESIKTAARQAGIDLVFVDSEGAGQADRGREVVHSAESGCHRILSHCRVRLGAGPSGGEGRRDTGVPFGSHRRRERRVSLGHLHGLGFRRGGAPGRALARRPRQDRQAGEHCRAAGDHRVSPRDRPDEGVPGDPAATIPTTASSSPKPATLNGARAGRSCSGFSRTLPRKARRWTPSLPTTTTWQSGQSRRWRPTGIRPGKDVSIVSVDGIRDAFTAMIAGRLNCSVECSPLLGPQFMKAVKDYMAGKDLPVKIITSERVFPAEIAPAGACFPKVLRERRTLPAVSHHGVSLCPKSAQNSRII